MGEIQLARFDLNQQTNKNYRKKNRNIKLKNWSVHSILIKLSQCLYYFNGNGII